MKITNLKQLRQSLLSVKGEISDVAGAAAEAVDEVAAQKQDKLTGQQGQVVGFDASGKATAVQGWSNPKLLINSDFRKPVNTNGKTEYSKNNEFSINLWHDIINIPDGNSKLKIEDGCIAFYADSSMYMQQNIDNIMPYISGRTVTVSALIKKAEYTKQQQSNNVPRLAIYGATSKFGATDAYAAVNIPNGENILISTTVVLPKLLPYQHMIVALHIRNATGSVSVQAIGLELGDHQTLAHQDTDGNWILNDPVDYEAEYAKCAQYDPQTGEWVGYEGLIQNAVQLALQSGGLVPDTTTFID